MKKIEIEIPDDCILVQEGDKYIVKKKGSKPRTWEEFCERYPRTKDEYFICDDSRIDQVCNTTPPRDDIDDKNICTSKEEAEAFLALMQLRQLRKAWIGNWDFETSVEKYACNIVYVKNKGIVVENTLNISHPLNFPDTQIAEEFLTCFEDLCETAKILL